MGIRIDLTQDPVFRDLLAEWEAEVTSRVEAEVTSRVGAEAEARGKALGESHGRADILLRQMTRKFGSVAPEVRARVRAATVPQLDAWAEALLEVDGLEDLLNTPPLT